MTISFSEHQNLLLSEALDSPITDYVLTDDTMLPDKVYATFSIEGRVYALSLLAIKQTPQVYILRVGRLNDKKPRWWKYHSPKDILPVLSTLLHFAEASMDLLKGKIQGIALELRAKNPEEAARLARIVKRVVMKSYAARFKFVPVTLEFDKPSQTCAFIARKGANPKTLFAKGFTQYKNSFDGGEIPEEVIKELVPKRIEKPNISTKPSRKYSFKGLEVKLLDVGVEGFYDAIDNITPLPPVKVDKPDYEANKARLSKIVDPSTHPWDEEEAKLIISYLITNNNRWFSFEGTKNGIKLSYFANGYIINETLRNIGANHSLVYEKYFKNTKRLNSFIEAFTDEDDWFRFTKIPVETIFKNYLIKPAYITINRDISNIDPTELELNNDSILSSSKRALINLDPNRWFEVSGLENSKEKSNYVNGVLEYFKKMDKIKNKDLVYQYTGSSYSTINSFSRVCMEYYFSGKFENLDEYDTFQAERLTKFVSSKNGANMIYEAFESIEPLPESLWVYRGGTINPKDGDELSPGSIYTSPLTTSTSLSPNVAASFAKNVHFRFYIPKGSKVLPCLDDNQTSHVGEYEIILPPYSTFKIISKTAATDAYDTTRYFVEGIFIGSVQESFMKEMVELVKKLPPKIVNMLRKDDEYSETINKYLPENRMQGLLNDLIEAKVKEEKYDPKGKFSDDIDLSLSKKVAEKLSSGNWKLAAQKGKT